jgi:hypothetical protein
VSVALAGLPGVIVGERGFRRLDTPTFRKVASGCSSLRVSWRC